MFKKFILMALLIGNASKLWGLTDLWQGGISDESYQIFANIYEGQDGFYQWKTDAEWIMSDDFFPKLIEENCNPGGKFYELHKHWIGIGLGTGAFDIVSASWPEENRDNAIPFMETMICFYKEQLLRISKNPINEYIKDSIESLEKIKEYFKHATNPDDFEDWYIKPQYR